ncbi:MAG: sodium:proton antiporter [Legionellales bacterium]|nr:sodium:proton antiporter [Legionellales bacterium]
MHDGGGIVFSIFLIFAGAAILSTLALYTRQSLLVVYMLLGIILGPWGLGLVSDSEMIKQTGEIGIIFLLFLLGLNLHPQNLWHMLRKVTWIALISSVVFIALGYVVGRAFGFNNTEAVVIGAAMMFSSTIIGLKLLPTTILHHQHTGEVMISILLMQDLIAIVTLLLLHGAGSNGLHIGDIVTIVVAFPGLLLFAFLMERYVLVKLLSRFDQVQEYVFLLSIAWCLGMAKLASLLGLSDEIGAFIAGVAIAASPIALYISESLKPLRDFFLVLFFFSIGASFNLQFLNVVLVPALILGVLMLVFKPVVFQVLLHRAKEDKKVAWEVGFRLGQISEFSLLVAYLAASTDLIGESASYLIQATTIITFVVSSYFVVLKYPTPLALTEKMRRD